MSTRTATLRAVPPVEELVDRITAPNGAWPPKSEAATWNLVRKWRAFVDHDRDHLARISGFEVRDGRRYRIDPLGDRIRQGWADHLFGEELEVAPAAEQDAEQMTELLEANSLTDECHVAEADLVVPEGEAWWRIYVDPEIADMPLLEWHSRASIAPLFVGRRLMACALISILDNLPRERSAVWRHLEIHIDGAVEHVLFRGTKSRIGRRVSLEDHPELEELARRLTPGTWEESGRWEHGQPMLMGRIVNRRGRTPGLGVSDFKAIEDQLLDLNEVANIAAGNVRLTARRRVVVSQSSVNPAGTIGGLDLVDDGMGGFTVADGAKTLAAPTFDAGEDVLIADPLDEELGKGGSAPFKVLEYSFDAAPLIMHKRDLVETALTRIGMTPQWVGVRTGDDSGEATSGTHYRLRMIPTDKAGRGKARPWDAELPRILQRMILVSELPEGDGGLGLAWASQEPPEVKRANPIPEDPVEDAQIEQALVSAGVRSIETSVRAQHPTWTDEQVAEELDRIKGDRPTAGPLLGGPGV